MTEKTLEVKKQEAEVVEGAERTHTHHVFVPRVDIYETNEEIVVVADMPGVDEADVDIVLEKKELKISGFVKPYQPEGYNLSYQEYAIGDFERSFILSEEIDRNRIEAKMKDGVLRLHLPKAPEFKTRKIEVKAG